MSVAVGRVCKHSKQPSTCHWHATIRILRYLLVTASLTLVYQRRVRPAIVSAYADAAYGNEPGKRSRYGHAIYLAGCLVN